MGQNEPVPSCSESKLDCDTKDDDGPLPEKRRKLSGDEVEKLEHRLGGILCCAVCLDLPQGAVYQCTNGHLMCAPCFTHLLADARLRDEASTCPNCRVEISKTSASRNLAVEKTVSELPSECKFCAKVFPRHSLQHHEEKKCEERRYKFNQIIVESRRGAPPRSLESLFRIIASMYTLVVAALRRTYLVSEVVEPPVKRRKFRRLTGCRFACIGCGWRGPQHEAMSHEAGCIHPSKSAGDLVELLREREDRAKNENRVYDQVLDLLSYEKITFNDLQLKPYRTEEFIHKLYYEASRFSAFGHQWVVKAFVNNNQRDPTQSYERELSYQLILKSKSSTPVSVQWIVARGPWGEARVCARVAAHAFSEAAAAAPPLPLPLYEANAANRLLANKVLHLRLIMFLSPN